MSSIHPYPGEDNPHHVYEGLYYNIGGNPDRDTICHICFEDMSDLQLTLRHESCGNCYHADCLEDALKADGQEYFPRSPMCRAEIIPEEGATLSESQVDLISRDDEDDDDSIDSEWTEENVRVFRMLQDNADLYRRWMLDMTLFVMSESSRTPRLAEEVLVLQRRIPPPTLRYQQQDLDRYELQVNAIEEAYQEILLRWRIGRGPPVLVESSPVATLRDNYYDVLSSGDNTAETDDDSDSVC